MSSNLNSNLLRFHCAHPNVQCTYSFQHDLQWVVALDGAFRQTLLHFLIVAGFACISSKSEPHFLRPPSLLHSWAVRLYGLWSLKNRKKSPNYPKFCIRILRYQMIVLKIHVGCGASLLGTSGLMILDQLYYPLSYLNIL